MTTYETLIIGTQVISLFAILFAIFRIYKRRNNEKELLFESIKNLEAAEVEMDYSSNEIVVHKTNHDNFLNLKFIDSRIYNSLNLPYYDIVELNIKDETQQVGNFRFCKKTLNTFKSIINPTEEILEFEFISERYLTNSDFKKSPIEIEKTRRLLKYEIRKDDEDEFTDITNFIRVEFNQLEHQNSVETKLKPSSDLKYDFSYSTKFDIRISEVRLIPISDLFYSFKVNRPTKSMGITYQVDNNYSLWGTYFGSFITNNDAIVISDRNSINIRVNRWLLPGNGIIIGKNPSHELNEKAHNT